MYHPILETSMHNSAYRTERNNAQKSETGSRCTGLRWHEERNHGLLIMASMFDLRVSNSYVNCGRHPTIQNTLSSFIESIFTIFRNTFFFQFYTIFWMFFPSSIVQPRWVNFSTFGVRFLLVVFSNGIRFVLQSKRKLLMSHFLVEWQRCIRNENSTKMKIFVYLVKLEKDVDAVNE